MVLVGLILFSQNVKASTGMDEYDLSEIGMALEIPSDCYVATRQNLFSEDVLQVLGLTSDEILQYMQNNSIYLDAFLFDPLTEIYVTKNDSTVELKNLQIAENELDEMISDLEDRYVKQFFSDDMEVSSVDLYKSNAGINYIRAHISRLSGDSRHDIRVYITINDYHVYHISLESYEGSVNISQDMAIMNVVNHVKFDNMEMDQIDSDGIDASDSSDTSDDNTIEPSYPSTAVPTSYQRGIFESVAIKMAVAFVLCGVAGVIRKINRKLRGKRDGNEDSEHQKEPGEDQNVYHDIEVSGDSDINQNPNEILDRQKEWERKQRDYDKTVLLTDESDMTVAITNSERGIRVKLTDLVNPANVYVHEVIESIVVGRSKTADICIPNDAGISRQHFRIFVREGELYLHDLGSVNPTIVNGNVVKNDDILISNGDELCVGNTVLRVSVE